MYKLNSKWHKFVTGVINNIGWILVILVSVLALVFTQLGTYHKEAGTLTDLYMSYDEYGRIHSVRVENGEGTTVFIRTHYADQISLLNAEIEVIRENQKSYLKIEGNSEEDDAYYNMTLEIKALLEERDKYVAERDRINSGVLKGISSDTRINADNYTIYWIGEYTYDKIISLTTTDIYSWVLVIMLAFSAILVKIQGNKTGKNSGFKLEWKTMARHATLSEKIAPRSKDAEAICVRMNNEELQAKREMKLQYVALKYSDVFSEDGTFLNNPNFVQVEVMSYKKGSRTILKENPYQKKLLKKQKRTVERLKKFKIKEVHTYILLESKAEAKERFDFGESLKARDRRTFWTNIITSFVTVLPMFTAVSVFVVTEDKTNLLVGVLGIILNLISLIFNMFGSYDYIINTWKPGILKKCDLLLSIGIELGVADEVDRNWEANLEKEMLRVNQNK